MAGPAQPKGLSLGHAGHALGHHARRGLCNRTVGAEAGIAARDIRVCGRHARLQRSRSKFETQADSRKGIWQHSHQHCSHRPAVLEQSHHPFSHIKLAHGAHAPPCPAEQRIMTCSHLAALDNVAV